MPREGADLVAGERRCPAVPAAVLAHRGQVCVPQGLRAGQGGCPPRTAPADPPGTPARPALPSLGFPVQHWGPCRLHPGVCADALRGARAVTQGAGGRGQLPPLPRQPPVRVSVPMGVPVLCCPRAGAGSRLAPRRLIVSAADSLIDRAAWKTLRQDRPAPSGSQTHAAPASTRTPAQTPARTPAATSPSHAHPSLALKDASEDLFFIPPSPVFFSGR